MLDGRHGSGCVHRFVGQGQAAGVGLDQSHRPGAGQPALRRTLGPRSLLGDWRVQVHGDDMGLVPPGDDVGQMLWAPEPTSSTVAFAEMVTCSSSRAYSQPSQ